MSIENEFLTVDLVADAGTATSRVDAFALSIIKAERQIRRLFTHIVFQCPAFGSAEVSDLRNSCPRSAQSVTNWRAAQGRLPSKKMSKAVAGNIVPHVDVAATNGVAWFDNAKFEEVYIE